MDKEKNVSLASDYEGEETDDSPWELSSDSSDGNQSAPNDEKKTHAIYGERTGMGLERTEELAPNPIILLGRSPTLEMPRILESIKFTITCLYKIPIRRPAPLDRLKTKPSIEASFYQHFDVLYVMDKFPHLDRHVATRLGKMISRRRQILAYRESHDQNLDTNNVKPETAPFSSATSSFLHEFGAGGQEAGSGSEIVRSQTPSTLFAPRSKATTLRLEESHSEEGLDGLYAPSTVESELSMASSYAGKDLHVEYPPRPKRDDGRVLSRFKCPYCLLTKMITSDHNWEKHVLEDLQPYVCTYPECELFDQFFKTQDEWYKHEAQRHRVKWFCNTDHHPEYETQSDFLTHLKQHHGTTFDSGQLSLMRNIFQRPSRAVGGQCNLCMRQSTNLRSHVSRHLKQMALFALPRANETANSDMAELSTHSLSRNKMDEEQALAIDLVSRTSQSTSPSNDNYPGESNERSYSQPDLAELDNVEVIDVPDSADPEWDKITDKFSKARIEEDSTPADSVRRFYVPLDLATMPAVGRFLGRQDQLDDLWQYLRPTNSQSRKVAILHGLGGIGKTQLAIRFVRDHINDFTAIFWLHSKDRGTLLQSLSSIFPQLPGQSQNTKAINDEEVEQRARNVLGWLALEGNSRWLIIFDNIDQYSPVNSSVGDAYDIRDFFPGADHGSILITSRLHALLEVGKSFPVNKLDSDNAMKLLWQSSGLSEKSTIGELESNPGTETLDTKILLVLLIYVDAIALTNRLDGLPLAIVIAGAFMRETGTSITEYLQYYQESWSDLQLQSNPERQYQKGNMLQTWAISYREVRQRDARAAELLLLLAHFDNRDIWYELIKSSSYSLNVPIWLKTTISSELAFKIGVKSLIGFSLLETKQQEGVYAMHPVVQDWCIHLAGIETSVDSAQLDELALISVGYTVPSSSARNYTELQQRLIPHANYVRHGNWSSDNPAVWGALLGLGNLYKDQGKLKEAEEMYQQALAGYEKALGPDHTSTLDTINNLGSLYKDQGKLKEAEEMYQQALAGYEKALGPDHTSTLDAVNNLGSLYRDQGKLEKAEEMYQRALAGYKEALGPDHTSALNTVNNLGLLYSNQGKLKEAEEMYQQALAGYEKALGPDHTSTLNAVNNLGSLYRDQGKLKEAEEMYQQALAGYEKALGPDHTSTLNTVNNLGVLYSNKGKLKEAGEMYQRALAGYNKALGPNHTSTLDAINNLGSLYRDQGKLSEAEEMYQRALAGYEEALGPDHTSTLNTVNNLGGKLSKAEEMYQQALAGYEEALGPDHTSALNTVNNLGLLYSNQGKLKEAEEMYQRALAGYEKALGPYHSRTQLVEDRLHALSIAGIK
ncbi:putative Pfs, NB-ARC and TPR domain protein [Aspergillus udagawae]|uniref:Putative Pfs, NB-ARC and TPR domain protein n=1 Tax=Aspergillus udagawae TaxID=91492 RepID=A0A8H3XPK4_9EURO|nr:putative Pfs, NB-ARC and TPR domain protein [Aspergillus udagawae]